LLEYIGIINARIEEYLQDPSSNAAKSLAGLAHLDAQFADLQTVQSDFGWPKDLRLRLQLAQLWIMLREGDSGSESVGAAAVQPRFRSVLTAFEREVHRQTLGQVPWDVRAQRDALRRQVRLAELPGDGRILPWGSRRTCGCSFARQRCREHEVAGCDCREIGILVACRFHSKERPKTAPETASERETAAWADDIVTRPKGVRETVVQWYEGRGNPSDASNALASDQKSEGHKLLDSIDRVVKSLHGKKRTISFAGDDDSDSDSVW